MQISLTKPSSPFSASATSLSAVRRLRELLSRSFPHFRARSRSEDFDLATLQSIYRVALLLTNNEVAAADLVTKAYERAKVCGHSLSADRLQVRLSLFEALYSALHEDSDKNQSGRTSIEVRCGNDSCAKSVRDLIQQQAPITRIMICLRHCEDLSLDQVAGITRHPSKVVQARLLEFRHSLHRLLRPSCPSDGSELKTV